MKGLGRKLRSGRMAIDATNKVIQIYSDDDLVNQIRYDELSASDWGFVYERHVGQFLEDSGYLVEYQGLSKGLLDRGIDLIATKDEQKIYIQCKHALSSRLSRTKIEWILYNASGFLHSNYDGEKLFFWLVVPSKLSAFARKKSKNGRDIYPVADYFLSKNNFQSKVKLEIHEVDMHK
jgi:hypothetical protein